jgi:hypothetical protein
LCKSFRVQPMRVLKGPSIAQVYTVRSGGESAINFTAAALIRQLSPMPGDIDVC